LGSYLVSPIDYRIGVASDVDGAAQAYANPNLNTVLVPSPLAHAFDYAARHLNADQIDACKAHLNLMRPAERAAFKMLLPAQQDLILDIKEKEDQLAAAFHAVVGQGAFIDVHRYVPTRRSVMRTAIPHIDQCDTHMVATLIGQDGTLLYLKDYTDIAESAFKSGEISVPPCDVVEAAPTYLCFIKGTDHPDVMENADLSARWHSSPVSCAPIAPRLASFYAMRNGLHG
jgi:hypothetical protein